MPNSSCSARSCSPAGDDRTARHPTDVVIVVKGPVQSITIREKEKMAGIWVNAERLRYRSAPSFYAIASSRPVRSLVDDRTRAIYEFGARQPAAIAGLVRAVFGAGPVHAAGWSI